MIKYIAKLRLILAAMILTLASNPVNDVLANASFYSANDIMFYSGTDQDAPVCGGLMNDTGDNIRTVFGFFKQKGLSDVQAAGAVGNIDREGGGSPTIVERNASHPELPRDSQDPAGLPVVGGWHGGQVRQPGYGLIQWTPSGKIVDLMREANITTPVYELGSQLMLLWWHMENRSPTGYMNMLDNYKTIDDIAQATTDFHVKIEGSADSTMDIRIAKAKNALAKYGAGGTEPVIEVNLESGGNCSEGMGSIVETALLYAHDWSSDMGPRIVDRNKPEYQAATEEAQAKGEYIGPASNPGVDCGAFVTRVMRNSGADPNYNPENDYTYRQLVYLENSPKYTEIKPTDTGGLSPGDIAIKAVPGGGGGSGNHTYIFLGSKSNGDSYFSNGSLVAEASISNRWPPQAGWTTPLDDSSYRYFRLNTAAEQG